MCGQCSRVQNSREVRTTDLEVVFRKMTKEVKNEKVSGKEDGSETERKKVKETPSTKVVIRCLPPTLTEADFLEQISPLPDNNYLSFVQADRSLEISAFCRAYINVINQEDILPFRDQWDGYPFTDTKGTEYPAVVEFAPYQKIPKKQCRKVDPRCGTIENDDDFQAFTESLQAEVERLPSAETYLEELEAKLHEKEAQEMTPLLAFLKNKKMERIVSMKKDNSTKIRQEAREERRRKEREQKKRDEERRQKREEERRRQREKQRQREREAKEKEKGKVKKEFDKEEPQKIKLLMKSEGEKGHQKGDASAPLDEKNKVKEKTGKRDQARQDDRKEKDSKSKPIPERYQVSPGTRNIDNMDKASQQKDEKQERKEWEREQQRVKEERTKDRDSQQGDRGGERPLDRDRDKAHYGDRGGERDIGQTRVEETAAEKGLHEDSLSKRQLQRDKKQRDSHGNRQTRQGRWESQRTKKDQPPSLNEKRLDRNNHQSKSASQSREGSSGGKEERKTAISFDKRPTSEKESSGLGTHFREGSAEKSGTTARGKDGSARLRNKDRPTMALYQPGQRPSVFKCQDVKEPRDKTKGHRSSSRDAEAQPAYQSDRTKTGSDKRDAGRDSKYSNGGREGASTKGRGEVKAGGRRTN
ncbi:regulator of nonsense transcripts 3A-like isoform X2 [Patiria miniata]|uniref:UPF3 domain-containing protein n=1 Tax=Patiria miniata TaxID=46514 RepID=A0A913ZFQ7_PATMI|nr:regulator of nonsense transcripts 3A-like isoform X2 [Patiria miniata]